jgi:hypothetical protein
LKPSTKLAGTIALMLSLAYLAPAQQSRIYQQGSTWAEERSGSLAGAKNLRIDVDHGNVRIQGGSQQNITYSFHNVAYTSAEQRARRELSSYQVSSSVRGDTAYITAEDQGTGKRCAADFTINVPRDMTSIRVDTNGGSVVAMGVSGRVDAQTGGGSIKLDDIGGSVTAETGGDWIDVGSVGGDVNLQTGGGKISIRSVKGKIVASTGGGDMVVMSGSQGAVLEAGGGNIQVKQCTGKLRVSTGGGNIDLGDIGGAVEIETGGGSIRLASAKGPVRAETGAGRIELNGISSARAETGAGGILAKFISNPSQDSALETSAGDITVYLAPDLKLNIRATIEMSNGHDIHTDFSEIKVNPEGGEYGPREVTAQGALNGGGPVLKVTTTSGDIRILKASR